METNNDGFTGYVYGVGWCESYAYTIGSATVPLDGQIVVDGESRSDVEYNETRCYKKSIRFEPHANVEFNTIEWSFGDGTTSTQKVVNHTYTAPGTYRIRMIITNEDGRDTAYTNLTLIEQLRDTVYTDICKGDVYKFANRTYSTTGKYDVKFTSSGGCDSIVTLCLTVHDTYLVTINATFPIGSSYRWRGKWYREEGTYYDTLTTVAGCDSILELKLTKTDPSEIMYDTICWQPTYEFKGHTFNIPSYQGFENEDYIDYVLEYRDKEACSSYKMNLAIAPMVDGNEIVVYDTIQKGSVYEWMGDKYTEKGTYYKTVYQACECAIDYTLYLDVLTFPFTKKYVELCHKDTYMFRGKEYIDPGVYYDTVWSATGIDTIYEIKLVDARKRTEFSISNVSSYTFHGKTYTESGTYVDTLQSAAGCDSIVILHLGIREKCTISVEENIQVCEGEVVEWNGLRCEAGKSYTKTFVSTGGCDSVVILRVEAIAKTITILPVSICKGDYYQIGGQKLYTEGEHLVVFTSSKGCDSVVVVQLSYSEVYDKIDSVTIKDGESYTWQGEVYSQAGVYKKAFIASNGCDSVLTLNVTILPKEIDCETIVVIDSVTICYGESYKWRGVDYSASGVYKDTLQSAQGCDSIVTLNLTVLPEVVGTEENATICYGETYTWRGVDYSVSGVYKDTLQTDKGCDSIVTLNLTVLPEVVGTEENATICYGESYKWCGVEYSESGVYRDTLQSTQGCDSIVTLNLIVLPSYIFADTITIQEGDSYLWREDTYEEAGVYSDSLLTINGCDSVYTLILIVEEAIVEDVVVDAINIAEQCAGTGVLDVEVLLSSGSVDKVSFIFNQDAIEAGFVNIILPYNNQMQVQYTDVRAGRYKVTVMGLFNEEKMFEEEKELIFLYPSTVLKQHWNDVVAVLTHDYNGGYNFVDFKWYKNGVVLSGETHSYICQQLEFGAEYSALLTEDNGTQLMTCPLIATEHVDISLYPTLLNGAQRVKCKVSEASVVYIYDMMGNLILELNVESGETELEMPYAAGVYMAKIVTASSKVRNIKLIVR